METQSAAYFDQQVVQEMGQHLQAPAWSVKQKLALTCQMLAAEGEQHRGHEEWTERMRER